MSDKNPYEICKAKTTDTKGDRRCAGLARNHDKDSDHYDRKGSWREDGKTPWGYPKK